MESKMEFTVSPEGRRVMGRQRWAVVIAAAVGYFVLMLVLSAYLLLVPLPQQPGILSLFRFTGNIFAYIAMVVATIALPAEIGAVLFFHSRWMRTSTRIDQEARKITQASPSKEQVWKFHAIVSAEFYEDRLWFTRWASKGTEIGDIRLTVLRLNQSGSPLCTTDTINVLGQHRSAFTQLQQFLQGTPTLQDLIQFASVKTGKEGHHAQGSGG